MERVLWRKLRAPSAGGALRRDRLLADLDQVQDLVVQAPSGAGKTTFLAQWLEAAGRPALYYGLDDRDRSLRVFAAHVTAGLKAVWPDWAPPPAILEAPAELAVEVVAEAEARPPLILVLDGLEAATGQPWLADFLAALLRYAPPTLTLALATRAPLPVDPGAFRRACRHLHAADLAFTREEAAAWLGADAGWEACWTATGGYPLALEHWRTSGGAWRPALHVRMLDALPGHVALESGQALVREWLEGRMPLAAFAHQVSTAEPGVDQLWQEVGAIRLLFGTDPLSAREPLDALWERARGEGNRKLIGAVALMQGEVWFARGEFGIAMDWFRRAFEADPPLELTGPHSAVLILRDQGYLDEAEALGRRCIAARLERGDLQALAFAHIHYGAVLVELDRLDEAEAHYTEAHRLAATLGADPFLAILAVVHRALLEAVKGNGTAFRKLAEEAYGMARDRRSPFFSAMCGHVLAGALLMWGEREPALRLLQESLDYLTGVQCRWHLHVLHLVFARLYWTAGLPEASRRHLDEAVALAARQGYVQYLLSPRSRSLPLLVDALIRGVEPAFLQDMLGRMGSRALPALLELTRQPAPGARRAALYPLAAIGGPEATAAARELLYDSDKTVREAALLALRSLDPAAVSTDPAPSPEAAPADEPPVKIYVLGPFQVRVGPRAIASWRTAKSRDLLAYLILSGRRPVPRDQLLEALWPESDPESRLSLLHTCLYYLRRALAPEADGLIAFAGGAYRLNWELVNVDLDRFWQLAGSGQEQAWREAAAQYQGDLLEGLDYPWAEAPRTRARQLFLETLRHLAAHLLSAGRHAEALEPLQLLVQTDPLAEDGYLLLMETYATLGNRTAALQQYQNLARVLDEELGLEPGEQARQLYRRLLG